MKSMKKHHHNIVFGTLKHRISNGWERATDITFCGQKVQTRLYVDIDPDAGLTASQFEAFRQFESGGDALITEVEKALLEYYQSICDKYRDQLSITDPADPNIPLIRRIEELAPLVTPEAVYFPDIYDEPTFGVLFKCTWEVEHGVAVVIENCKVKEVGYQDIIL